MDKDNLHLISSFFTPAEAACFFQTLTSEIEWQQKKIKLFGKSVLEPRLTAWVGDPQAFYTYSGTRLIPRPWTLVLLEIKKRVEAKCGASFNSVLLNFYRDHNDSMGLHSDDEKELGAQPVIASVSLGATRRFVLKHRFLKALPQKTFLLEAGDLLILRNDCQKLWKHGIPKEKTACGPRINLTFRKINGKSF